MACSAETGASSVMLRNDTSIRSRVLSLPFNEHRYNVEGSWSYLEDLNARNITQLVFPSSKDSSVFFRIFIDRSILSEALWHAQVQEKSSTFPLYKGGPWCSLTSIKSFTCCMYASSMGCLKRHLALRSAASVTTRPE